jgi:MFS family permease
VVTVMLAAIALDQGGEPAAAPALAAASSAFGIGMRAAAWLTMSYNIGYLAATIVSVWAIVRFGKRSYLTVSLATYAVASVACAAAPTPQTLLVARFLLGASAGGFFTSALLTIVGTSPKSDLPIAMTVFATVTLLAPTLAPLYAGIALQAATWRAVFAASALPAAVGALLAHRWMTDVAAPRPQPFDRTTFGLLLVGLASYQFLVNQGASVRWFAQPSVFVAGALVATTIAAYAVRELRVSSSPFLDLRIFRSALLGRGLTVGVLLGMLLGATAIEASYARSAFSFGPVALGAFVAIRGVGIVIGVGVSGWLTALRVPPWIAMCAGMTAVAATCLAQSGAIVSGASASAHALIGIVQGAAFAVVLGPLATTLFDAVDRTAFATLAVLFKLSFLFGSGLTFAIAATVTAQASGSVSADVRLWLGAAVVALVTATWSTSLRSSVGATT